MKKLIELKEHIQGVLLIDHFNGAKFLVTKETPVDDKLLWIDCEPENYFQDHIINRLKVEKSILL
ncbi:hypothetical protein [Metabacillus arenae]|uniref:Uncharacterized protein n=1 Tax=Metabacillus arenae TaxID=2771434 RepID=A0A926RVQ6_9BACI|nr:hypothetical protein [Metabacillus arenae]MBD1379141.1 hypothetical protein [Metabacillus arenae]